MKSFNISHLQLQKLSCLSTGQRATSPIPISVRPDLYAWLSGHSSNTFVCDQNLPADTNITSNHTQQINKKVIDSDGGIITFIILLDYVCQRLFH